MQAILTKFLCPTDTKGSRYKAACARGSLTVPVDHSLNPEGNHARAARLLADKFVREDREQYGPDAGKPWTWPMVSGQLPNGQWAHVTPRPSEVAALTA